MLLKLADMGCRLRENRYKWIIILIFKTLKFSAYTFMRIGKLSKKWKIGFIPNFLGIFLSRAVGFLIFLRLISIKGFVILII